MPVRRTLLEQLQKKPVSYYMREPITGLPQLTNSNGQLVQPRHISFFAVGDRIARVCLSGPIVGLRGWTTTVSYDSWDEMPAVVAEKLTEFFSDDS